MKAQHCQCNFDRHGQLIRETECRAHSLERQELEHQRDRAMADEDQLKAENARLREALQRYLIGHGSDLNADCPCRVCEQARRAMKPLPTFEDVRGILADSAGKEGK